MEDDEKHDKTAQRRTWPGGLYKVGLEPGTSPLPADVALASMRLLSERSWRLTGRPFPNYRRADMPGRMIRGS